MKTFKQYAVDELDEARRDVHVIVDKNGMVVANKMDKNAAKKAIDSMNKRGKNSPYTIVLAPDANVGAVLKKFVRKESVEQFDEAFLLASEDLNAVKKQAQKLAKQFPKMRFHVVENSKHHPAGVGKRYEIVTNVNFHMYRNEKLMFQYDGAQFGTNESVELDEAIKVRFSGLGQVTKILKKKGIGFHTSKGNIMVNPKNLIVAKSALNKEFGGDFEKKTGMKIKGIEKIDISDGVELNEWGTNYNVHVTAKKVAYRQLEKKIASLGGYREAEFDGKDKAVFHFDAKKHDGNERKKVADFIKSTKGAEFSHAVKESVELDEAKLKYSKDMPDKSAHVAARLAMKSKGIQGTIRDNGTIHVALRDVKATNDILKKKGVKGFTATNEEIESDSLVEQAVHSISSGKAFGGWTDELDERKSAIDYMLSKKMKPSGTIGGKKTADILRKGERTTGPTRVAVDKEFTKMVRSGKMDTGYAIKHVEKKFKIKNVKVQKDKNGKTHVTSFNEEIELDEASKGSLRKLSANAKKLLASAINMALGSRAGAWAEESNIEYFTKEAFDGAMKYMEKNKRQLAKPALPLYKELQKFFSNEFKESVELDEAVDKKKLLGIFNKLKKNDTIKIKYDSSMRKGKDFQTFVVTSPKRTVGKAGVERVIMKHVDNPKGVKYTLYNRGGSVSLAVGDMAAVMTDIQESVQLAKEKGMTFVFPDERKAKQFDLDIENSAIGVGDQIGNKVTVTGVDTKWRDAVKKAMLKSRGKIVKESVDELDEGRMKELHMHIEDGKTAEQIAKLMKLDVKTIKALMTGGKESVDEKVERPMGSSGKFSAKGMKGKFAKSQLDQLRVAYGKIGKINPESNSYKKLIDYLNSLKIDQLKQLVDAKIPFMSSLAFNRFNRMQNPKKYPTGKLEVKK